MSEILTLNDDNTYQIENLVIEEENDSRWLDNYRTLSQKISEMEKERDLIKSYFISKLGKCDGLVDKDGVVLATYKHQTREYFDVNNFKKTHENLYQKFTTQKESRVFLLKK